MLEQKIERVPWTIKQTFNGVFFTLVPWIAFTAFLSLFNTGSSPSTPHTLPLQIDFINAIFTFIFSSVVEGAFLIAPVYYAWRVKRFPSTAPRSILDLLGFRRFNIYQALLLVLGFLLFIFLVNGAYEVIIKTFGLNLQTNDQVIFQRGKYEPLTIYATLVAAVVVAPFCEEVFFRSFVFMGLLNDMTLIWSIVLSALIFAAAHGDPASFPVLFFIGLALAFIRWKTNSFWPGFMLHFLNNGISAVLVILSLHGVQF